MKIIDKGLTSQQWTHKKRKKMRNYNIKYKWTKSRVIYVYVKKYEKRCENITLDKQKTE